MINFNGKIIEKENLYLGIQNRAFKYGDAIFDTLKFDGDKICFIEDHYFRLMSSMRMLRMHIAMDFTLQYYEEEIMKVIHEVGLSGLLRIRVSVSRKDGGLYAPDSNDVDFVIEVNEIKPDVKGSLEIELFKDFPVFSSFLSTIKTNNRMVNVLSSIFANENGYDNCILINENKNIVEASNANVFLVKGNDILTPPLSEGCVNGVVRKKIIELLLDNKKYKLKEIAISPFELLKADEVFLTNSIFEIQSIDRYRKKSFSKNVTDEIRGLFKVLS